MPFEFLRCPLEIREMIYEALFDATHQEDGVASDPYHSRRQSGKNELTCRTVSGGGFLRSCKQAYEEASPYLWRNGSFYFDDVPHGSESVFLDPAAKCECPSTYRTNFRGISVPFGTCQGDAPCRRQLRLPVTDFVTMPDWLDRIGERNRARIRHITLHLMVRSLLASAVERTLRLHSLLLAPNTSTEL